MAEQPFDQPVASIADVVVFDERSPASESFPELARQLAGETYRPAPPGDGLIRIVDDYACAVTTPRSLMSLIIDIIPNFMAISSSGKPKATISAALVGTMLESSLFRAEFRILDDVISRPIWLPSFELSPPGYSDAGPGHRVYYAPKHDEEERVSDEQHYIGRWLEQMSWADSASATNWIAASITVILRHHWPGGKPLIAFLANKSHSGKTTLALAAAGLESTAMVSFTDAAWALEMTVARALKATPDASAIIIDNARDDGANHEIKSASLERAITDTKPFFFSSAKGESCQRSNLVFMLTANNAILNEDLCNRCLPITLQCDGDPMARETTIGNPRYDFLAKHRYHMHAEILGMIHRWVAAGKKLDPSVMHPMATWARTVGGILRESGYTDFLQNYDTVRKGVDALREAITILGASKHDLWMRPAVWAEHMHNLGLTKLLVRNPAYRGAPDTRAIGLGRTLSAHQNETFRIEHDDGEVKLFLHRERHRVEQGSNGTQPKWGYRFETVD